MGGTYQLTNFSNRNSDHPTRRRLIPVEGQPNVYDVAREEGIIRNEGTPWGATIMNQFDQKIDNMFPVSIENGGTGATDGMNGIKNLAQTGTFTPEIYSFRDETYIKKLNYSVEGTRNAIWYKLGQLVFVEIYIKGTRGLETDAIGTLAIGRLPFYNLSSYNAAATVSEFALYDGQNVDRSVVASGHIKPNDVHIIMYKGDGGVGYPVSAFGTGTQSTSNILDATISIVYLTN